MGDWVEMEDLWIFIHENVGCAVFGALSDQLF
jgi:hypothetical protein